MKRRIRKKKGMFHPPTSREIREQVKKELETEALLLEQKACRLELPGEAEMPDTGDERNEK